MDYTEHFIEKSETLYISELNFKNIDGKERDIRKYHSNSNNSFTYLLVLQHNPESEYLVENYNRIYKFLESFAGPNNIVSLYDDEDEVTYCVFTIDDCKGRVIMNEWEESLTLDLFDATQEKEKKFDRLAINILKSIKV